MNPPAREDSLSQAIRILLVEDSLVTRVGTRILLETEPEFVVLAQACNGNEGLELYAQLRPDLVITDLRMPELDGVRLTELLVAEDPPARVLVLTHYDGEDSIFRALRAGALGYVTKEADRLELFAAIRTVAKGDRYLPAAIAEKLSERQELPALSAREQQVLELICKGLSNKEIASNLNLSEKTISMFVVRLYAKLKVHSRAEAVALGIQRGLVVPS